MWQLPLQIKPGSDTPVFAQIASSLAEEIRRGRLGPGAAVPGSRSLAGTLGVHRNTVLAAYDELIAQGWLRAEPGRGTFVSDELPLREPRGYGEQRAGIPARPGFRLGPGPRPPLQPSVSATESLLPMGRGVPDLRLVPHELLARAYRRNLRRAAGDLLGYGDKRGHPRLLRALVDMLNRARGLAATTDEIIVTQGSQMALDLVARALISPGDAVAVESFSYAPARKAFANAGGALVPVAVDRHGMRIDELEALAAERPIRAVYLTPHHQYPTTAVLSVARRQRLLAWARRGGVAVIEDDYDNEVHYQGRPVLPLASADRAGVVVYVGSLSKILAPGLRIGYLVAPRALVDRLAGMREAIDGGGDRAVQCAVAELLEEDEVQKHARRVRRIYRSRRDLLLELLAGSLGGVIEPRVPAGGMALWARVHGPDPEDWAARAADRGVHVSPGRWFSIERRRAPYLRLGFAACDEDELRRGVEALVRSRSRAR